MSMSPRRWWFQNLSGALAVLLAFLPIVPSTAEAAPKPDFDEMKALKLDARAQLQVTDPEKWKKQEAARNAINRMVALEKMREHSGAKAQEQKAAQAKKVALEIQRARPTAAAERALAKGKVLGMDRLQKQLELQKADPQLVAKLKTRKPPAVDPDQKPKLDPARLSPVQLPKRQAPRKSEHGALTPALKSFYASVAGEGAEVLQDDGTTKTVEETLAELSLPPQARLHASLTSDLGMLMAPLSALPPPTADDLLETSETRRSPELLALVQQLGTRPLDLYNFVHTKAVPQLYYGSKKGAAQTLAELSGNDFDQASLLIALLRAAGHPARYEYGTVDLSETQAKSLTGAKSLAAALVMLSRTSPAALAPDGKTIQQERAWVRAYVPYELDRGSAGGVQKQWVRLDPGLKETKDPSTVSLKGLATFDRAAFPGQPASKTPLDVFEAQLLAVAKSKNLCNTLDVALSRLEVTQKPFAVLPAEHPSRVVTSLAVFARPPSMYRHQVEVTLDGTTVPFELAELEGRALSLTYPGTTATDAAAISAAGGIANVNPQFVSVRPTLAVDGVVRGTFADVNPGTAQRLSLRLQVPAANAVVGVHHLVAGTPYAVLVEGGSPSAAQLQARLLATAGTTGEAQWLARAQAAVAWYAHHTEATDNRLYGLQGHGSIKDAFFAVAGKQLRVQTFLGLPVALAEGSYVLDVSRDPLSAMPRDGDDSLQVSLVAWSGWQGSVLEGRAWEVVLGGPGMSSVKALQVATSQLVPVYVLTPTDLSNRANLSGYSADTLADIDNALAAKWTATVPQHPVSIGRFQNVEGYILENPVNGEGAFRLGSSLNGGEGDDLPAAGAGGNNSGGCCRETNSTVALSTGAWRMRRVDLTLPAVGMPVVFSRVYSSQATELTPLGYGWMHSYGMFLKPGPGSGFTYVGPDWKEVVFAPSGGGSYASSPGWFLTLTDVAGGGHAMRAKDGIVWEFDSTGALTRISEPSGNATTLTYSGGQLAQVKDSGGQVALTLSYTGSKLTSVLDRAGRLVRFGHTNDDLTAATDVLNHTETYGYDNAHNMTSRTDKRGEQFVELYDLQDRWVGFRDPLGAEASVAYDFVNGRTVYVDRIGAPWTTEFDANGNATAEVDPVGNRSEATFDSNFKRLTSKDARGFTTTMTYDGLGNQLTQFGPDGIGQTFTYEPTFSRLRRVDQTGLDAVVSTFDAAGRVLTRTDGLGTTSFGYDALGQLETVTAPGPAVTTFGRDSKGNVTSVLDATSRSTGMGYDSAGHLTSTTDGNLHTRTMVVDAAGRVLEMRDALLRTTEHTYDDEGNRLTSKDPENAVTQFEFDALGRMTKTTDALGNVRRTEYDAEGRVTATVDAKGNRSTMKYDAAGRLVETTAPGGAVSSQGYCANVGTACALVDPLGHLTTVEFDSVGRVTRMTDPLGRVATTTYDGVGRAREVRGPMQVPTRYDYQLNGLLSSVTNLGLNEQTLFEYDARGNRTTVWANYPSAQITRYTFDLANRLLTEKNPLGTVTSFTYDAAGNRATKLDGNGQTTSYGYDDNRRLTTVTFSDATKYEYAYDTRGNRTLEKNANHERQLAYDALNRVQTVTDVTFGKVLSHGYDANGNRTSLTEGATTFGYFYDGQNRLKRADAFGGSLFFEYDAAGRRTSVSRPNGIRTAYSYDDASQILGIVHAKGPQVVLGFTYGYDAHGMRTSKTRETGYREAYGYDLGDRLVRVDYGTVKRVEYGLDLLGNRGSEETTTSPTSGLVRNAATFNAFNQLTSSGGPGTTFPATANSWDLNGNLLTEVKTPSGLPAEVTTYAWNKDDRLVSVTSPTGTPTGYRYEANGLRIERIEPTGIARYLLDGQVVLAELDSANAAAMHFLNHPQKVDEPLAYQRAAANEYTLLDALGSVYAVTNANGTVVHRYDFDVYGLRADLGGTSQGIDIGYTSRTHDDNGLVYHRNRYRNPGRGGWLSADRLGLEDGPNIYNYVHAHPTDGVDPDGLRLIIDPGSFAWKPTKRADVEWAYATLKASLCVRQWFSRAWGSSGSDFGSSRGLDPFAHDIFVRLDSNPTDVFDLAAYAQGAKSYWNLLTDTITLIESKNWSYFIPRVQVIRSLMHEMNNWAAGSGDWDNTDPIRGSYTSEGVAAEAGTVATNGGVESCVFDPGAPGGC